MAKNVKVSTKPENNLVTDVKDFGKHIKYKRTHEGITLSEAAELCNINARTLMKIEKGAEGVRFSTVLHVARMFGLKIVLE